MDRVLAMLLWVIIATISVAHGQEMGHGEECTPGAADKCSRSQFLDCIDNICECTEGLSVNNNKTCYADFRSECVVGDDQPRNLVCNSDRFLQCASLLKKCGCQNPSQMMYDQDQNACTIILHQDCKLNPTPSDPKCVANAFCKTSGTKNSCTCIDTFEPSSNNQTCVVKTNPGTPIDHGETCTVGDTSRFCDPTKYLECIDAKCDCTRGLLVNKAKVCQAGYGSTCQTEAPISNETCNPERFLVCHATRLKCACRSETTQIFDEVKGECSIILGEECLMNPTESDPTCVSNAYCKMEGAGSSMIHFCECDKEYGPSEDEKTCKSKPNGAMPSSSGSVIHILLVVGAFIHYF